MWLNRAISTLWPVYNEAIAKMAIEQAKPQIDAALKGVSPLDCCAAQSGPSRCIARPGHALAGPFCPSCEYRAD